MVNEQNPHAAGTKDSQQFDELQRGQETAPTVETLERLVPGHHGERREIPIPDPGERPGAVRIEEEAEDGV